MKRFLLILTLCLTIVATPAFGQNAPTLSNLEISLWPEFDQPEVLVIYRGVFEADTPLPVPVEIRIPARVDQPTAVAYVDEGGQRFNQQYTTRVEDDWLVVSFELATPGFQLEYYDTLLVDSTGQREYDYTYTADYGITALALEFQVPPTAQGFVVEPPADSVAPEADGLVYHRVQVGSVGVGETMSWTFAYQKDDLDLTVSTLGGAETPVPAGSPTAEGADNSTVWVFLIAFVALLAVGAGAFWLGRGTQPVSEVVPPASRRQKRRGSGRGGQAQRQASLPRSRDEVLYCFACGAQLRRDSEFCHRCGATVRKE